MNHFLLAIETSSEQGSIAILSLCGLHKGLKGKTVFQSFEVLSESAWSSMEGSFHSETITVQLINCLKKANIGLESLNYLAVSAGPGSFTGLRVGINVVRTLAFSLNIPIFSVHSLRVLAQNMREKGKLKRARILTLTQAHRGEYFGAFFEKKESEIKEIFPPMVLEYEGVLKQLKKEFGIDFKSHLQGKEKVFCLGKGFLDFKKKDLFPLVEKVFIWDESIPCYPLARHLGEVVFQNFDLEKSLIWRGLKPLYLRSSSAEEQLKRRKKEASINC